MDFLSIHSRHERSKFIDRCCRHDCDFEPELPAQYPFVVFFDLVYCPRGTQQVTYTVLTPDCPVLRELNEEPYEDLFEAGVICYFD